MERYALVCLLLLGTVTVQAQNVEVESLRIGNDGQIKVGGARPRAGHPRIVGTYGFWGTGFRPRRLSLSFRDPEIDALSVLDLPQGILEERSNEGGVTFGLGFQPLSWLRVPEVRLSFGGGGLDTRWRQFADRPEIEGAMKGLFTFRIEVLAGVEYDLGPITPFLRGYAAVGFHAARIKLRHTTLGNLGTERVRDIQGELGIEAGVNVMVSDEVGVFLAYRRGLVGPQLHGVTVGIAIRGEAL